MKPKYEDRKNVEEFMRSYLGCFQDEFRYRTKIFRKDGFSGIATYNNPLISFSIGFRIGNIGSMNEQNQITMYWISDVNSQHLNRASKICCINSLDPEGPEIIQAQVDKTRQKLRALQTLHDKNHARIMCSMFGGAPTIHFEGKSITLKEFFRDLD